MITILINHKRDCLDAFLHSLPSQLSTVLVPGCWRMYKVVQPFFPQNHFACTRICTHNTCLANQPQLLQQSHYLFKVIFNIYIDKPIVCVHRSCYHSHKAAKSSNSKNISGEDKSRMQSKVQSLDITFLTCP